MSNMIEHIRHVLTRYKLIFRMTDNSDSFYAQNMTGFVGKSGVEFSKKLFGRRCEIGSSNSC